MVTPPPRTRVYLYRSAGISGGFSDYSPALLELTDSTVRCTLTSTRGYSGWLAKRLHLPDLKQRLEAGEPMTVFEFPRNGYRIKWPMLALGELFKIGQGGAPDWVVRFSPMRGQAGDLVVDSKLAAEPGALGVMGGLSLAADAADGAMSMVDTWLEGDVRKQWRQALDPTGQRVPSSYQRPNAAPAASQQQAPAPLPSPGWYPDPAGALGMQRYWDGTRWNPTAQRPGPGRR